MKRVLELCMVAGLCLAYGLAQDTTQKQMSKPTPPPGTSQRMAMHEQMMKGLQADLDSMRANLQRMKAQLGTVKDQGAKEQARLNIAMWQSLIDTMDKHLQVIKSMAGPGMHDHDVMGPHNHNHEHEHEHEHRHGAMPTPSPTP
jgi:hypothetical protein